MYNELTKEQIKQIESYPMETVIAEFAGRDSVAAIIKALERDDVNIILPIASFSPTEFGDIKNIEDNYKYLKQRIYQLYGDKKQLLPLFYHSIPDIWTSLNGRFVTELFKKFSFYSPCLGCHAYFHIIKVPIALKLGKKIISGERVNHDGRVKLNQMPEILEAYQNIIQQFGAELLQPIKDIEDGNEIEKLIGYDWKEGKGHVKCAFSGNYNSVNGKPIYDMDLINEYLEKFLQKACVKIVEAMNGEDKVNFNQIIIELLNE